MADDHLMVWIWCCCVLFPYIQLGGVILPHDGLCKVFQPQTDYNEWNVYDYPSIGQIAEALRRNDIIPIFAAERRAKPIYDVSTLYRYIIMYQVK